MSCSGAGDGRDSDDDGCPVGQIEVLPGLCVAATECPPGDPDWETNLLSLSELEALAAAYKAQNVIGLFDAGCESVRVGIDARNGRTLYSEIECNDLCPDYTQRLLTYGPEASDCAAVEQCYLEAGAQPGTVIRCLPVLPQGVYGSCYCPAADPDPAARQLDESQMIRLAESYRAKDGTAICQRTVGCDAAPVATDARNGRTLFAGLDCRDDPQVILLTYGPDYRTRDACEALGGCVKPVGTSTTEVDCLPVIPDGGEGECS